MKIRLAKFSIGQRVFADGSDVEAPTGFGRIIELLVTTHDEPLLYDVELGSGRGVFRYHEQDLQDISDAHAAPAYEFRHTLVGTDGSVVTR